MSNQTDTLTFKLALSGLSEVEAGFREIRHSVEHLSEAILPLLAGAGFAELAKQALEFNDQALRMAQQVGLGITEMAGLSYAANKAEVDIGTLRSGLRLFSE